MIIYRFKENDKYIYKDYRNNIIKDKKTLEKINNIVVPPAYENVKIYLDNCSKILYEGYDSKGRLQQIYTALHRKKADKQKFCRLIEYGKILPKLQSDINNYIKSTRITKNKIISTIIKIIMTCGFRIGNIKYKILYGSTGISNICKKNIKFNSKNTTIKFIGKKGVLNECNITDASIIKSLHDLLKNKKDNDYIFTYMVNNNQELIKPIDINKWLESYGNFVTKDIRTWNVNIKFIEDMKNITKDIHKLTITNRKKNVVSIIKDIAISINNTPAICKKSYIHPSLIDTYINNPRTYKRHFIGESSSRIIFLNFLKCYCK